MKFAAAVCIAALCACRSAPQPAPEPWMPTGAAAEVLSAEEAAAQAQATIRDDNADAVYEELVAAGGADD